MRSTQRLEFGVSDALRFWAAFALIIVFYIPPLAMLVGSGLLMYYAHLLPIPSAWQGFLSTFPLVVGYAVIATFAPRRDLKNLGVQLTEAAQPDLFRQIGQAAEIAGVPLPAEIFLWFEESLSFRRGTFGRRILCVGFAELQVLSVSQLQAVLIRQLCRRHLRLILWFCRMGLAHRRSTPSIRPDGQAPFEWYTAQFCELMERLLQPIHAAEDRFAAEAAGSDVYIAALSQSTRVQSLHRHYVRRDIGSAAEAGFILPMSTGFQTMLSDQKFESVLDSMLQESADFQQRIRHLQPIASGKERDDRPALSLLRNLPEVERELTLHYLNIVKVKPGELKPLEWENRGTAVEMPLRRQLVAEHAKALDNLRLSDVFEIARGPYLWAMTIWGVIPVPLPPIPFKRGTDDAKSLLESAIMCRLHAIGWTPKWDAGSELMTLGDKVFDAHRTIEQIHSGALTLEQWNQQIEDLGLFPTMPLSYISVL